MILMLSNGRANLKLWDSLLSASELAENGRASPSPPYSPPHTFVMPTMHNSFTIRSSKSLIQDK
jgi:hypothetical protein